jgi:hypothetical protein
MTISIELNGSVYQGTLYTDSKTVASSISSNTSTASSNHLNEQSTSILASKKFESTTMKTDFVY